MHDEERRTTAKVTVVGTGQVGMAAAFAMMTQVADVCLLRKLFLLVNSNLFLPSDAAMLAQSWES